MVSRMNRQSNLFQTSTQLPMQVTEILENDLTTHRRVLRLMGNRFEISVVGDDARAAEDHIESAVTEIIRIEKLLTTFSDDSQTNNITQKAGIRPIEVDEKVFDLIGRS